MLETPSLGCKGTVSAKVNYDGVVFQRCKYDEISAWWNRLTEGERERERGIESEADNKK